MSAIAISSGCTQSGNDSLGGEPNPILGAYKEGDIISLVAPKDCFLIEADYYMELAQK